MATDTSAAAPPPASSATESIDFPNHLQAPAVESADNSRDCTAVPPTQTQPTVDDNDDGSDTVDSAPPPPSSDTCDASLPALRIFLDTAAPTAHSTPPPADLLAHCAHLESLLRQRDTAAHLHARELSLQRREQAALRTALEAAQRQSEATVVRYAQAEKTLLDLRRTADAATKRAAADAKTTAALTARAAFIGGERDRAQRDHRKAATETEALRHELFALESRLKAAQAKCRAEAAARVEAEQRTAAADRQLGAERNGDREADAQVILLRHAVAERERECGAAQARIEQLTGAAEGMQRELAAARADVRNWETVGARQKTALAAAECSNEEHANRLVNLTGELTDERAAAAELRDRLAAAEAVLPELTAGRELCVELQQDMQRMREQDDELREFARLLTEKSVRVENDLILMRAKATALDLSSVQARAALADSEQRVAALELQLAEVLTSGGCERSAADEAVRRAEEERDAMRQCWEGGLDELEVCRRKHGQVVKELQREIGALRQQVASVRGGEGGEQPQQQQQQLPSRKSLIDRIAKLQRILARQTEKIEFLENHSAGLVNQLKVLQQMGGKGRNSK